MLVHHGLLYNRIFLSLYSLFPMFRTQDFLPLLHSHIYTVVNVTYMYHLASLLPWTNPSPPSSSYMYVYVLINVAALLPQAYIGDWKCLWGNMNLLKLLQVYS